MFLENQYVSIIEYGYCLGCASRGGRVGRQWFEARRQPAGV
ncbi:hypothetical protein RMSM_03928 [Rhodopirellula maiorica SM1]|uniref:Uncharacterized protein n=1 Tax=Rhodopirellula maiorica SM1 TaxID=1265738 RepID=M5RIX5_9BACT|nr:hypothetical protein RMSM_03928 [Rhodopirellula maiorica SM1]